MTVRLAKWIVLALPCVAFAAESATPFLAEKPRIIAGSPDLGPLTTEKQQPVDFAVWQAADGTWQLWSCIRNTKEAGKTRLFFRWEAAKLSDEAWKPMGIAMQADAKFGETPGGLQAPHVIKHDGTFYMFYGDWEHICLATSRDGKAFTRHAGKDGKPALFGEAPGSNTRDPMVVRIGELWHCYYTAYPNDKGAVYCRTSKDLLTWSDSRIVAFGGRAGTGKFSAECPFVVQRGDEFYLFRTQRYGQQSQTSIYRSKDPMNFGVEKDEGFFVGTLPVAAPEIVQQDGGEYMVFLLPSLKGFQMAKMGWADRR